ncbi:MAG: hypothetical protein AAF738_06300 [Bacteroidota bacterium]
MLVEIAIEDFKTIAGRHLPKGTIRHVSKELGKEMIKDGIAIEPSEEEQLNWEEAEFNKITEALKETAEMEEE